MNEYVHFPGLDFDFLRYVGVEPATQRRIQGHYLPMFAQCRRVLDLGCGDGDFLALLAQAGIEAVGVDSDEKTLQAALTQGLPVIKADGFDYLAGAPAESFDGIFCAHLVEHLPYHLVVKLVQAAFRVLQPGGVIVLATPNVRSIFSHLEMFYLHFGHVNFYHPRLLCFFLEHEGFVDAREGVNPETASPMLPGIMAREATPHVALRARLDEMMQYRRQIPVQGNGMMARLSQQVKARLTRWLVQPLLDDVAARTHQALGVIADELVVHNQDLASINGPFECYAVAKKKDKGLASIDTHNCSRGIDMQSQQVVDTERIAERWDDSEWAQGVPIDYWSIHPLIEAYIASTITPFEGAMQTWLVKNFLSGKMCERALSVCCGMGVGDRQAISAGVCRSLEGFDISAGSIHYAQTEARKAGMSDKMHDRVADANSIELAENRYDVALAFGALHHVENLEHICQQLQRSVKPDGILLVNEYIGPKRLQWTDEQLEIINRVMSILPSQWLRAARVTPPLEEHMIAGDPSEAVRSNEVFALLLNHFEVVDYADYGGGLLMPLWSQGINPKVFLEDNHVDKQVIIKLLIMLDELLVEHKIAPSNYGQLVLRNRPPAQPPSIWPRTPINTPARSHWTSAWLPGTKFARLTPFWKLPIKAWQILRVGGPRDLAVEIKRYLQWIQLRKNKNI